jgi:hypothetical protein
MFLTQTQPTIVRSKPDSSLQEPANQFYGDRVASVRDSFGNNWYIATQIEVISREEIEKHLAAVSKPKE